MMKQQTTTRNEMKALVENRIKEFKDALTAGIDGIVRASEIYVASIDEDPASSDKFRDTFADYIPSSAWANFEAVGRKWMHPRLLMGGMADRKKHAVVKRLPYSVQERIFSGERFKLLTAKGDTLNVDLMEATAEQVEQICGGGAVKSLGEQRAWIEEQSKTITVDPEPMPYVVSNGKVSFRKGVVLTRNEVKRLLQEM
jgi:hypothetical protein